MELRPNLDPARGEPLYKQLSDYFQGLIQSGMLRQGERLPATRALAGRIGVHRATVSAAYELLESCGLISGQVGRGSFVSARDRQQTVDWSRLIAWQPAEALPAFSPQPCISFAASRPPEDLFPVEELRRSAEEVLSDPRLASILQLGSAGGYEPLRRFLIDESREEGVLGPGDDLMITNGCQQALDLLGRVLVRPGMRVAVEDPVYPGVKNLLRQYQADLAGVPVGSRFNVDAALFIVTPSFQNPTGETLTIGGRESLLADASQRGAVLVENDIYSTLRYEGEQLASLKKMAPRQAIVLLRSFSKIAFPGLRLGWVIGPRPLIASMREAKQLIDLHSGQFSQAVMLRFAESGRLAAHQARMVEAGRERLHAALSAARESLPPGSRWTTPAGGLNLWVTLGDGLDAGALLERAQGKGVAYLPGSIFGVQNKWRGSLRISFGSEAPEQIRKGMAILGNVFGDERQSGLRAERQPAAALV